MDQFSDGVGVLRGQVAGFFTFIAEKLQGYPELSLGEQIAYALTGVGLLMLLVSLVLFVL